MLDNPSLVNKSNIAEDYDFCTGKASASNSYDEIHTGDKWEEAGTILLHW